MNVADFPDELIAALRRASHVVFLTGAGVSAESGIPTFRDPMTGLWARYDPMALACADAYRRDPELVWGWYEWRRMGVLRARPNGAHLAIAAMATRVPRATVVTQNVDDLHERAGSRGVLHLHGRLDRPFCFACRRDHAFAAGIPDEPEGGRRLAPPRCAQCGGPVRPGVVWFGEALPEAEWEAAVEACGQCDVLFSIGTSAAVQPAAGLSAQAARRGACVVQVNPQPTPLDGVVAYNLAGPAGEVLPALYDRAWGRGPA
ncbi:SIR2 family NAD-dependent protein deacylase [Bordetella genomosp. 13]|uniref:SIR2 family NAD-dependent protein deacylase n=1 Tax=Bordetella genomosp. 13 TaxID=463040 RepID=UPI0011A48324|nr:NAD-dependent deacylase [Bordetella genomosp. 13]